MVDAPARSTPRPYPPPKMVELDGDFWYGDGEHRLALQASLGWVQIKIVCTAGSSAWCRWHWECDDVLCEDGPDCDHENGRWENVDCAVVAWTDDETAEECYAGPTLTDAPLDAPVIAYWNDGLYWRLAPVVP